MLDEATAKVDDSSDVSFYLLQVPRALQTEFESHLEGFLVGDGEAVQPVFSAAASLQSTLVRASSERTSTVLAGTQRRPLAGTVAVFRCSDVSGGGEDDAKYSVDISLNMQRLHRRPLEQPPVIAAKLQTPSASVPVTSPEKHKKKKHKSKHHDE